jgi:excisionase family DNA binding protein
MTEKNVTPRTETASSEPSFETWISVKDAARRLGVTRSTIYRRVRTQTLKATRNGRRILVLRDSLNPTASVKPQADACGAKSLRPNEEEVRKTASADTEEPAPVIARVRNTNNGRGQRSLVMPKRGPFVVLFYA